MRRRACGGGRRLLSFSRPPSLPSRSVVLVTLSSEEEEEANYGHLNGRIGRGRRATRTEHDGPAHSESVKLKGEWADGRTDRRRYYRTGEEDRYNQRCPNGRESMARLRFLRVCDVSAPNEAFQA